LKNFCNQTIEIVHTHTHTQIYIHTQLHQNYLLGRAKTHKSEAKTIGSCTVRAWDTDLDLEWICNVSETMPELLIYLEYLFITRFVLHYI